MIAWAFLVWPAPAYADGKAANALHRKDIVVDVEGRVLHPNGRGVLCSGLATSPEAPSGWPS